jgi:hypothetical protein
VAARPLCGFARGDVEAIDCADRQRTCASKTVASPTSKPGSPTRAQCREHRGGSVKPRAKWIVRPSRSSSLTCVRATQSIQFRSGRPRPREVSSSRRSSTSSGRSQSRPPSIRSIGGALSRFDSARASLVKVPVVISRPFSPRPAIAPRKSPRAHSAALTRAGDLLRSRGWPLVPLLNRSDLPHPPRWWAVSGPTGTIQHSARNGVAILG